MTTTEPSRRRARQTALVLLYQHDLTPERSVAELAERYREDTRAPLGAYALELVQGVLHERETLDERIGRHARGWATDRISPIERSALRIAVWELERRDVPAAVAIDEAVRLTKRYASPEAATFANGVLGAVARELGVGS